MSALILCHQRRWMKPDRPGHDETVSISQREMSELFDVRCRQRWVAPKNIFEEGVGSGSNYRESSVVQNRGRRRVQRPLTLYNLDAILAVGYRRRSPRGCSSAMGQYGAQGVSAQGLRVGR